MSFAEVLAAAKELTADEQRELARELTAPPDDIPEHLRPFIPQPGAEVAMSPFLQVEGVDWNAVGQIADQFLPPPGTVPEMNWPIEASAENIAALKRVLAEADARP
jgi:hypothetical protein